VLTRCSLNTTTRYGHSPHSHTHLDHNIWQDSSNSIGLELGRHCCKPELQLLRFRRHRGHEFRVLYGRFYQHIDAALVLICSLRGFTGFGMGLGVVVHFS
jgi:hypothetical protein